MQRLKHNLLYGKGIFMFLRSVMSSQISTIVDYIISFVFFAAVNLSSELSACFGAVAGGIVNCITNYKFTFKIKECSYFAIGVKFFLIWTGSLLLNTFGTGFVDNMLTRSELFDSWGVSRDMIFAMSRISTSLLVSIFWNFLLQRYFVFSPTRFDNFLDRLYYYLSALHEHNPK
ncbi:MAG: GtrA family protein [Muribaculaceae bacterium]|nr:GtrA family protein [Muribaculaceae bacterium]